MSIKKNYMFKVNPVNPPVNIVGWLTNQVRIKSKNPKAKLTGKIQITVSTGTVRVEAELP